MDEYIGAWVETVIICLTVLVRLNGCIVITQKNEVVFSKVK